MKFVVENKRPDGVEYMFQLAIVKGIKEHNDGTAYFGSLLGYSKYEDDAKKWGWITNDDKPTLTPLGERVYAECNLIRLPTKMFSRAYTWDGWNDIKVLPKGLIATPKNNDD
jgi:hypothetical protein